MRRPALLEKCASAELVSAAAVRAASARGMPLRRAQLAARRAALQPTAAAFSFRRCVAVRSSANFVRC